MNVAPISAVNNNPSFTASGKGLKQIYKQVKTAYNDNYNNYIIEPLKKKVLAPVMDSKFMLGFADNVAKSERMAELMPTHMSTAGSIVTTYFYANQTKKKLQKDEEQKKRAKTLMLNQWMVTGVSTAISYLANGALNNFSKKLGYRFRELNQGHYKLPERVKGFEVAKQLLIFTTTFRYVSPVIVTPLASKISKIREYKNTNNPETKKQAAADIAIHQGQASMLLNKDDKEKIKNAFSQVNTVQTQPNLFQNVQYQQPQQPQQARA